MNKKLSDDLKHWRSERPDEWTMDRFIKSAEKLEHERNETIKVLKNLISELEND